MRVRRLALMAGLRLRLEGRELLLPDTSVHYLWTEHGRLRVGAQPPRHASRFGYLVSDSETWWLHTNPLRRPADLRLDGRTVSAASIELVDAAELSLNAAPSAPAPPPPRAGVWVIGRLGTAAHIEIDDPLVRADHALLEADDTGRWRITEATGRLFVDGARATSAALDEGKVFVLGQTSVTASITLLAGGTAAGTDSARGALSVSAGTGLPVELRGVSLYRPDAPPLDEVDLRVRAGEVVAVVGPAPSGLVGVLLGDVQPDRGTVRIGGTRHATRSQVRFVPRSDELYPGLTVAETLRFAARFRAARDAPRSYVDARVAETLAWLGLLGRRDEPVPALTDAERRRLSIGVELVGLPQLLVLDEPTGGLDPAAGRDIMSRLNRISRELHCTVVVVTHAGQHLEYVDQLVVMTRGGRVRYAGPPVAPPLLGHATWADWMAELDREPARRPDPPAGPPTATSLPGWRRVPGRRPVVPSAGFTAAVARQLLLLTRRDWRWLAVLLPLPVLGLLVAPSPPALLAIAALTGCGLTHRELAREREVLRRDWRVGVNAATLVLAKATIYGAVCVVLAGLVALGCATVDVAVGFPALAPVMLAGVGLGLLMSSTATYAALAALLVAAPGALPAGPPWAAALVAVGSIVVAAAHTDRAWRR